MTKLVQTQRPASQASWTEHFYSGALKVVNGVVETDNEDWIDQLKFRGFEIIKDKDTAEEVKPQEVVTEEGQANGKPRPAKKPRANG